MTQANTQNEDHLFARAFAVYLGSACLVIGLTSLIAAYQFGSRITSLIPAYEFGSRIWDVRFGTLGDPDGPQLGLLIECVRLFLVVVLGLSTICLGFTEEVARLFRPTHIRESWPPFWRRRGKRAAADQENGFRLLFLVLVLGLAGWKAWEVFDHGAGSPTATLLQWGVEPSHNIWTKDHSDGELSPVVRPQELTFGRLQTHYSQIQWTYTLYLPYTLVNYALIIPLTFVVPLYSAACTDRRKLRLFRYYRLLQRQAPQADLQSELQRIQARCFDASQRYLYLCAALGIVFVYVQFDPTLAHATRTALKYIFYVLVGGSALAVLRLWGQYYAAWNGALVHLLERGESTREIQEKLSPLKFGQEILMQTPQGIVAASLLMPTLQQLLSRFLTASG